MRRISVTLLLICSGIALCLAQDTVKRKSPVSASSKYKTYKYLSYKHRTDSAAVNAPLKPDTGVTPPVIDKGLNGQYQYLLSKVYHYQQPLISALWKSASDTLKLNKGKLRAAQDKLALQNKTIDSLNTELTNQGANAARANEINFFGVYLAKGTYNTIVWSMIILLAIIAAAVMTQSGGARREAKYRTQLYSELEEEFKAFKAKANDKEKKLARELQTERNKVDELTGKG